MTGCPCTWQHQVHQQQAALAEPAPSAAAAAAAHEAATAELAAQRQQEVASAIQGEREASAAALAAAREEAELRQQEAAAAQQELSRRLQEAEARLRDPNAAAQVGKREHHTCHCLDGSHLCLYFDTCCPPASGGIFRCSGLGFRVYSNPGSQNHVPLGSNSNLQPTDMATCTQFDAAAAARSANVAAELEAALGEATAARAEMVRWRADALAAAAACDEVKPRVYHVI